MSTYYIPVPYGPKKRKQRINFIIARGGGSFLLPNGMIEEAISIMKKNGVKIKLKGKYDKLPYRKPSLPGITFRKDQMRLIKAAVTSEWQRGILVAPTGTGKTVLAAGIISAVYPESKILFLAHTTDLVRQFYEELLKWGFDKKEISILSGADYSFKPITCTTIQKLSRIPEEEWKDEFDCVLIDEGHHVSKVQGSYGNFLTSSNARMRIGFTATMPEDQENLMTMHALIGPVLEEVTMKEAADEGMIVMPTVHFLTYKPPLKDYDLRSYADVYDRYVVKNGRRNDLILDLAEKYVAEGKAVLIGVKLVEHLAILVEKAKRRDLQIYGAQGKTSKDERKEIIEHMKSGKYMCAIATKIFSEGVNIPKLSIIINGAAGKSPIENLQRPGRGTRTFDGKDELLFFDFVDPLRYLAEHSCERMKLYSEQGWKITVSEPFVSGILERG
jgi:superfamily II DNA or RNA helicase